MLSPTTTGFSTYGPFRHQNYVETKYAKIKFLGISYFFLLVDDQETNISEHIVSK